MREHIITATVILLICVWIPLDLLVPHNVQADKPYRFERLAHEEAPDESPIGRFEVWHDRESGVEFICAITGAGRTQTCFPTGRSWTEKSVEESHCLGVKCMEKK